MTIASKQGAHSSRRLAAKRAAYQLSSYLFEVSFVSHFDIVSLYSSVLHVRSGGRIAGQVYHIYSRRFVLSPAFQTILSRSCYLTMVITFPLSLSRPLSGIILFLHILGALAAPLASNNAFVNTTAHLEQRDNYHWDNVAVTFLPYNRELSYKDNWAIKFGERMILKTFPVGGSVGRVNLVNRDGKNSAFAKINAIEPTGKAQFLYKAMKMLKNDYNLVQNERELAAEESQGSSNGSECIGIDAAIVLWIAGVRMLVD
ncbi:hypothetical protein LENED_002472 [Lentinula edodes]|uniref:Uncharacterized protein n=1 Tax=Lentinula edodes TaxID=5353 RepID=A0A1Q3E0Z0_LENED|nr:hypothetical protein LENED_002472 [Lentinula edodes]